MRPSGGTCTSVWQQSLTIGEVTQVFQYAGHRNSAADICAKGPLPQDYRQQLTIAIARVMAMPRWPVKAVCAHHWAR